MLGSLFLGFILFLLLMYFVFFRTSNNSSEKGTSASYTTKTNNNTSLCREKYADVEAEALAVLKQYYPIKFGAAVRRSTIEQLIFARFYFDERRDTAYLSVNTNGLGVKAIYQNKCNDASFSRIIIEEADTPETSALAIGFGLIDDPTPYAIKTFNDMERPMNSLRSLPMLTFSCT